MYKSERSSFSEDNEKPFSFGLQTLKSLKVGGGFQQGFYLCWGSWDHYELQFSLLPKGIYSLQCVINMEKHHLVLGKTEREEIPFVGSGSAAVGEQ